MFEDVRSDHKWFDQDYNDLIFQVRGAEGDAVHLDEIINPEKDWRGSELGEELLSYVQQEDLEGDSDVDLDPTDHLAVDDGDDFIDIGFIDEGDVEDDFIDIGFIDDDVIDNSVDDSVVETPVSDLENILEGDNNTVDNVVDNSVTETPVNESETTSEGDNNTIEDVVDNSVVETPVTESENASEGDNNTVDDVVDNSVTEPPVNESENTSKEDNNTVENFVDNSVTEPPVNESENASEGDDDSVEDVVDNSVTETPVNESENTLDVDNNTVENFVDNSVTETPANDVEENNNSNLNDELDELETVGSDESETTPILTIEKPIPNLTLTNENPTQTVDLAQVFHHPNDEPLTYELLSGDSDALQTQLDNNQLTLTALPHTGTTPVTVRAVDGLGNSVTHTFTVTTNALRPETLTTINHTFNQLTDLTQTVSGEGLLEVLETEAADPILNQLDDLIDENPELLEFMTHPETLSQLGLEDSTVETVEALLENPEIGEALGFEGSVSDALNDPSQWETMIINAQDAVNIVPEDAPKTTVGFLDFQGTHSEQVTEVFESVNPRSPYQNFSVDEGNWAEQLTNFVDHLKEKGENKGIVNLSFDLTQIDAEGRITTRYELTAAEQAAIAYAQENNVLIITASGNTGDKMSALGAAAEQFDNIITVGAVNRWENVADYSGRGEGLTLVATGGQWENDPDAFVGTSKATSYVTGAASLVWEANPGLNYQQVKELLVSTATDMGPEGWDAETGAGLLDVTEAVMMANWVTPLPLDEREPQTEEWPGFSGTGRVTPTQRAASEKTENAIANLKETQESLIDQWTVLWLLGNPELTLEELKTKAEEATATALDTYQQVNTQASKTVAKAEQLAESLTLANRHDRIEQERLQAIVTRQEELMALLDQLSQQKAALEQSSTQQKAQLEENITKVQEAIAEAKAKLDYLLVDPQTLLGDPDALRQQATDQLQLAQTYEEQAQVQESQRQQHLAQSKVHEAQMRKWQVVGYTKNRSGRRRDPIWGWVTDTEQVKLRDQHQWEAEIAAQNSTILAQLAEQLTQQGNALNEQANLIENNNIDFANSEGTEEDAGEVLGLLQQQATAQQELAAAYWEQAEMLEKQRVQNQRKADWHTEQSRRWEVVGYQKKRSGRNKAIYDWREYPEHIPLAQQAQQLADQASQELAALQQLAQQAQQESDRLTQQAKRLNTLVNEDWQKIKQGIEYEITGHENRLQGEQDLLALTTAKTENELKHLNLQIEQTESELEQVERDRNTLEQKAEATAERLSQLQTEWEDSQTAVASAQQQLQQFLDSKGHFLPYRERLVGVQQAIEQLELEKVRTQGVIEQLQVQVLTNTDLEAALTKAEQHLDTIERDLQWAQIQQDSLNLSALDSPQRLELKALLTALEKRKEQDYVFNSLPLEDYLEFIGKIEEDNTNFLTGFDQLQERLTAALEEQGTTQDILSRLEEEYRNLGLEINNINHLGFVSSWVELVKTEVEEQQTVLNEKQAQIDEANAIAEAFEQQRLQQLAKAEKHEGKIQQWEVVKKGNKWKNDVYGWVYHPEEEAQRDVALAAAAQAEQQRDEARIQAQSLATSLQPEMAAIQQNITDLGLKQQVLEQAQTEAENKTLAEQITAKETEIGDTLAAIAQVQTTLTTLEAQGTETPELQATITEKQTQLTTLNTKLDTQQQEKTVLEETRSHQEQLLQENQVKLSDKYQEIGLTERVLEQINYEIERLENRHDLINHADELETQYQTEHEQWQTSADTQNTAITALLATREQGESDRTLLLSLQGQRNQLLQELQPAKVQQNQLQPTLTTKQEALALTELQLGNQQIKLQSLQEQDVPLQNAEAHFYNLAETVKQKIWTYDQGNWVYNVDQAEAYREALQNASLMAHERNKIWPAIQETQEQIVTLEEQQTQQQHEVQQLDSQLTTLNRHIEQLETEIGDIEKEIAPIAERLKPLQELEQQQLETFQTAASDTQTLAGNLAQTTAEQVQALRRLISFGVLASESDIDFFTLEIEPKILEFRDRIQQRSADFTAQVQQLNQLITSWEEDLTHTPDEVSQQAIQAQIDQTQQQIDDLLTWKSDNATAVSELEGYLQQAEEALQSLRLQQELQVREDLLSNEKRLESLNAQLRSENAAEEALNEDTILGYANLSDRVREDLETVAQVWTEQLQEGHSKTQELGELQTHLSQSVDDLIAEIENKLADPHSEYHLSENELRDAIAHLAILAPRRDHLNRTVTGTEQSIEKILQRIEQDAQLWEEIAPIATRYGVESQEFEEFEAKYKWYKDQDRILAEQYEQERHNYQQQADHWKSQIETWGVVGTRKSGKSTKPVYGWIHNPQAEANYNAVQAQADAAAQKRDLTLELPQSKAYRDEFLNNSGTNGAAIAVLQERTKIGREEYQPLYEEAKAKISEKEAILAATLAQADWYEKQAAMHKKRSEELFGSEHQKATWTEDRRVKYKGNCGKTKWKTVTITHVNHDWITWDNYTKIAANLRQQAAQTLQELEQGRYEKERWQPLADNWTDANNGANEAANPIKAARNLFEQLETERESLPQEQVQLNGLETLLPTLKQQLEEAQQEADAANAKALQDWLEYDEDAAAYQEAIANILDQRGELDRQSQTVQNELADTERWVERQSVELATEKEAVKTLKAQLQDRLTEINTLLPTATGTTLGELQAKQAQLAQSVNLLTNKATVLTQQQTALTHKRTLLTAQNEVILAEQRLLDAYLVSPDEYFSALQDQLNQAREALANAEHLAAQAESSSQAITDPLQQTQSDLLAQNDEHLKAAKEKQAVLKELLTATQLNANYTLEAFQKQQELNDLEFQVLQRLQEATLAGSEEAQHLLNVAQYNSLAAASEIYYRDYADLASDNGGSCSGGLARPEDRILADKYYQEWLKYAELKRQAQSQAEAFTQAREAAEAQITTLQEQQQIAAERLSTLNEGITTTEEEIAAKEAELGLLEARIEGLERVREQTEQTFIQLLTLEQLNLSQAQLEQKLAELYQGDIDRAVQERLERDRLELERQRLETQAKIEQLQQLQAEENLRQALNEVRSDVGLTDIEGMVNPLQLEAQLAGLFTSLQGLQSQQSIALPEDLQALLTETQADLLLALQGDKSKNIQANLLQVAEGLIEQINQYKAAIAKQNILTLILIYPIFGVSHGQIKRVDFPLHRLKF